MQINIQTLDATPSSDLNWDLDPKTIPYLDFQLEIVHFFDAGIFNAHLLAVEEFSKKYPHIKKVILGFFNAPLSIERAQFLSEYLHRLASALPFETDPIIVLDVKEQTQWIFPFCRRRFEHFQIEYYQKPLPIEGDQKLIISLPQDDRLDENRFNEIASKLTPNSYKCIPEELLNEHWDGVEEIIYDPETIGELGKRMLLGFEAAGGTSINSE